MHKQYNTGENNITFSQSLLNAFDDYRFYCTEKLSNPTQEGHGPFCKMVDNQSLYDLRYTSFIFGKTHPLSLRAKSVLHNTNTDEYSKLVDQLKSCANEIFNITPDGIFANLQDIFAFLGKNFPQAIMLNFNSTTQVQTEINNLKKNDHIILHLSPAIFNFEKIQLDKMFKKINNLNLNIIVVEDNLIGLTSNYFSWKKFLSNNPIMIFNNFCFDYFFSWNSKPYLSNNLNIPKLIEMELFLSFMKAIHFWEKDGRIQTIQKQILNLLPENEVEVIGNFIIINKNQQKQDAKKLQLVGLLSEETDQNIILRIPFSIKESHLNEIANIIKNQIRK